MRKEHVIPKKIHYIWFGQNPKSEIVLKCIESWKRYFPDYEIIEWNEHNYDITKNDYVREAYKAQKWAFASDYARFDIINRYGGIYLDTDVEFLKPLPDEMLDHTAFTGFESSGKVAPGLIYAAPAGFQITEEILNEYDKMNFSNSELVTVNTVVTKVFNRYQELKENEYQIVSGMAIYPSVYFCGYDQNIDEYDIRPETICVHHYAATWTKKITLKKRIQKIIKITVGIKMYRKLLNVKRFFFGISK